LYALKKIFYVFEYCFVIEQRNSRPGIFWPVSRESLHNFLISFDRLIASKTFACRVFYGRQTAQMDGRTWSWSWGLQQSNSQGVEESKTPRRGFQQPPSEDRHKRLFACIWESGNCQMRRPPPAPPDDSIFN